MGVETPMTERQEVESLKTAADRAMVGADPATARGFFRQAVGLASGRLDLWLGLAACERGLGDHSAALVAAEAAMKVDPRAFPPVLMKAYLIERMGAPHGAGAAYGVALTQAPPDAQMPPAMRA